jgi:predicted TIM-barrel fold metal-dependent hydrolase
MIHPVSKDATPQFKPPPLACDAHCHVFGPAAKFPYDPKAAYTPEDAPFEHLQVLHKRLGVERAVIVHASCHGADMRATLDAIARSKGAYRGTAIIDSSYTEKDFQRMHDGGIRGVRFNFVKHLGGMPEIAMVEGMAARIAPLGWHLQLHLEVESIPELKDFLNGLRVPFIIDHMGRVSAQHGTGQPAFRQLLELMRGNERAWIKVSGPERVSAAGKPFHDAIPFAQALIGAAPDRVLWGTDFPHPNVKWMPNDGEQVDLFARMCEDDTARKKILVDNPTKLYWAS